MLRSLVRWINRSWITVLVPALLAGACTAPKGADATPANGVAQPGAPSATTLALSVVGAPVRRGDLILTIRTTGQVRSAGVAHLKAENTGTVADVRVRPGERVSRGQVLVQLDPRPFDLAVEEAKASLAQSDLSYQDIVRPDSIVSGVAASPERKQSAEARSGVLTARVRLQRAELDREQATIKAPFDGIVDEVSVAAGERVSGGQPVVAVVDLANLWVEAAVLEHDLPVLRIGGEASVVTPAAGSQAVAGTISAVLPLIDTLTRAGRALIKVHGEGTSQFRPGMYADVKLESGRLSNRVLVPATAVIERDGRPLVFVVKQGRAQWVYITPGRSNGSDTEVLADSVSGQVPLAVGDTVIIEGHLTLTHDAPVRVTDLRERSR